MRSERVVAGLALALAAACATPAQREQCYPVASWAAPVFECGGEAPPPPPPPVVIEQEPEPPPPEPPPPAAELKEDKIELNEKVSFEAGKAILLPQSETLLDEVARILEEHPEILRVRIEGHTSSEGGRRLNRRLSDRRAKAVRSYLIAKGIAAKRLQAKGFGPSRPIADNGTLEGREQNRRVEIHVVKRR